jgi:hypothetical protein
MRTPNGHAAWVDLSASRVDAACGNSDQISCRRMLSRAKAAPYGSGRKIDGENLQEGLTMAEQNFDPEKLRPAEWVCEPDPRSTMWVRIDRADGTSRPIELADPMNRYQTTCCMPAWLRRSSSSSRRETCICIPGLFIGSTRSRSIIALPASNWLYANGSRRRSRVGRSRGRGRRCVPC